MGGVPPTKGSNGHMTIGTGEMENITVGKGGGGCSTNNHMTVGKEGGAGWRRREKGGREGGEEKRGRGERWAWQACLSVKPEKILIF